MPNSLNSIAQHYHERTKYDPETIASKGKGLDWSKQPAPYKEYKIGRVYDLKPYLSSDREIAPESDDYNWLQLSLLLLTSYGLTAQYQTVYGNPIYLRAAPSAGGLYPAEVYIVSKGNFWLPAGLYNYQVANHSLVHFWDSEVWLQLQSACFEHPVLTEVDIALVTTAVFYRSAWRYEDRAYRRIFLDTGHLLGNVELAASINNYKAYLIGGFNDLALNKLLYLDAAEEGAIAVIPLMSLAQDRLLKTSGETALASNTITEYPDIADGKLLAYLHQATQMEAKQLPEKVDSTEDKYNFPFCTKVATNINSQIDWGEKLSELENTILKRRSTRNYSGSNLKLDELKALLHFTYQSDNYLAQGLDDNPDYFTLDLIETFIAVSGVDGLDTGCYYYAPQAQELRQVRFKNFRRELHYLCLGQNLGRDAAAIVFHTADLEKAIAQYGDRVYRYLHMDAGHLGQRLNLAAIRLDLGVSGIAGFFDNQVNEVLGIPAEEAVIYLTTLGSP
ncbi:SagB-type dehydrogenase domain protein [Hyella patelloides LEGE 07179]|uniref:SagB-type dehydrogenase domain protein n=1 Tax=Hyella patelloides LEGE 07179 TaxID=945734 RepID=A0A563VXF0_9CYAN|nr:SagB/ThcOx family dehydrogenase [Hyella patelloides]VEP16100.1 SagB-type dehydrogenase domain protein [Hyella patelloides LEGE 07179]